jgi:hypothetical protein
MDDDLHFIEENRTAGGWDGRSGDVSVSNRWTAFALEKLPIRPAA